MNTKSGNMKRLLALLLTVVMLVSAVPLSVFAAPAEKPQYQFGSKQTVLKPGRYDLPISMMKATDTNAQSMAKDCVKSAVLEVMENGDAYVTVSLGPVSFMGFTAWASDWEVYNEYSTKSEKTAAEVTGKDGENVSAIRFKLPYTDKDGVFAHLQVKKLTMKNDCFLKMDFEKAASKDPVVPEKKSFAVNFAAPQNGTLTAAVDGKAIQSGDKVEEGKTVTFTAAPAKGFELDSWTGVTGSGLTASAEVKAEMNVSVAFRKVQEQTDNFLFGSAKTKLEPGTYTVPISLQHADNHKDPSLAKTAFPESATLTVAQDGKATLTTAMKAVTMGPVSDMAYEVKVYPEDNYTSKAVDATVLETIKKPEPMPESGKDVPTKISFQIPNNSWDGVYVNFKVDAMGGATPNGWLKIDYTAVGKPGEAKTFKGSAKVDQFGKYTIDAVVTVKDGVISNVDVSARDFISDTYKHVNEKKIAQAKDALKSTWNGMAPNQENAEKIFKAIMKPDASDEVLDAVSGATYSAKAVRDAVMDAFQLTYEDEVIKVPEKVEPGVYEVDVGYYSDVVWHSLVENAKAKGKLTVAQDGSMMLDLELKNGTKKEPLYILDFNGVYPDNNTGKPLTMEGCTFQKGLSPNDYSDKYFEKGTQVVNHVSFPLLGGLTKVYNTNARLYVPAMNKLNGELSGVKFENGKFSVNVFAKIFWDSMRKVEEVPPAQKLEDGKYTVDAYLWHERNDTPSMGDKALENNRKVTVTVQGGKVTEVLVTTGPVDMKPFLSAITHVQVDGKDVTILEKEKFVTQPAKNEYEYIKSFSFLLPDSAQPQKMEGVTYAPIQFKVPDTPMGDRMMDARIKLDWGSAEKVNDAAGQKLEDGNYYVDGYLWHEKNDTASMGDAALKNSRRVLVSVKDGKVTEIQVATGLVEMKPFVSAITQVQVDGKDVTVLAKAAFTSEPMKNEYEYIKAFSFRMPENAQPEKFEGVTYVPIQFMVPDTPMGNNMMNARIKLDWGTAGKTDDTSVIKPDVPVEPEPQMPAFDAVDEETGIKVHADAGVLPAGVKLVVSKPTAQEIGSADAQQLLNENYALFDVHFEDASGSVVEPDGLVTISFPVVKDAEPVLYRVNADGSKTLVRGTVTEGYLEVIQKKMGVYALKGYAENSKPQEPTKPVEPSKPVNPGKPVTPQTGDHAPVFALIGLALVSAAAAMLLILEKNRKMCNVKE